MSSSIAADALRVDDRDVFVGGNSGDLGISADNGHGLAQRSPRVPPWPQRRLNDALADLGPARPRPAPSLEAVVALDEHVPTGDMQSSVSSPDFVQEPANDAPEQDAAMVPATGRPDLPPPPRPYLVGSTPTTPSSEGEIGDGSLFAWEGVAFSDVDPEGADIVRALALADFPSADEVVSHPIVLEEPEDHVIDQERPPMIIERALAEQGLGLALVVPVVRRGNPLPAIAVGFSLSLLIGAALYLALAG